jgi:predicted transcriptional regulator
MNNELADPHLTTKIVTSYVRHHPVGADQVSDLITTVHRAMGKLGQPVQPEEVHVPAVSVRRSVSQDYVVCLDCGFRGKMLQRHIARQHGLSRDEYLKRWGLRNDHPLTAPAYSERRSTMAKELGLGRKPTPQAIPAVTPTVVPMSAQADDKSEATPTRRRRPRPASKSADAENEAAAATPATRRQSRSAARPSGVVSETPAATPARRTQSRSRVDSPQSE